MVEHAENARRRVVLRIYMVGNQAIVIPETIDAIRALTGLLETAEESIAKTDAALGMGLQIEALGQ